MKKSALTVIGLLSTATAMTFATSAAFAQQSADEMQRVEVSGSKLQSVTRFDVSKVCPGIARSLQEKLAITAYREDETATVRVNFRLNGNKIDEVYSSSGPSAYRMAARRAVHRLDCADASSGEAQNFSFLISFIRPSDEVDAPSLVALLER